MDGPAPGDRRMRMGHSQFWLRKSPSSQDQRAIATQAHRSPICLRLPARLRHYLPLSLLRPPASTAQTKMKRLRTVGSVALTPRGTICSVLATRDRHYILWLDGLMQQSPPRPGLFAGPALAARAQERLALGGSRRGYQSRWRAGFPRPHALGCRGHADARRDRLSQEGRQVGGRQTPVLRARPAALCLSRLCQPPWPCADRPGAVPARDLGLRCCTLRGSGRAGECELHHQAEARTGPVEARLCGRGALPVRGRRLRVWRRSSDAA